MVSSVLFCSVVLTAEKNNFELGTRVIIWGTNEVANSSGVTNPSFQCLVDGESISIVMQPLTMAENRLWFCEQDGLLVGQHQISVAVTVSNQETFWFDNISYLPTASILLTNATLSIDFIDLQIQYGSRWISDNLGSSTLQNAATLSFSVYWCVSVRLPPGCLSLMLILDPLQHRCFIDMAGILCQ